VEGSSAGFIEGGGVGAAVSEGGTASSTAGNHGSDCRGYFAWGRGAHVAGRYGHQCCARKRESGARGRGERACPAGGAHGDEKEKEREVGDDTDRWVRCVSERERGEWEGGLGLLGRLGGLGRGGEKGVGWAERRRGEGKTFFSLTQTPFE